MDSATRFRALPATARYALAGVGLLLAGLVIYALPDVIGFYYTDLANRVLLWAIFAVAYNLSFEYADLPSFGHGAFFGLGAYGVGIALLLGVDSTLLALLSGVVAATAFGAVVAVFATRVRGIYFALITFAFAQFTFEVFFRLLRQTGGSDGLLLQFPGGPAAILIDDTVVFYASVLFLAVALLGTRQLVRSPYGAVLAAVRYNHDRARALGYPVKGVKMVAFVFSAALSGVAGVLFAMRFHLAYPSLLAFETSFEVLVMTIIGGSGTLVGPAVGAVTIMIIEEVPWSSTAQASLVQGAIFIFVLMYEPGGITPILRDWLRSLRSRRE